MSTVLDRDKTRFKQSLVKVRDAKFGAPPTNYLKVLREESGLTLEAMAKKCGVSKQALIRLEQGTYERILPSVLDVYVRDYTDSELRLVDEYEQYQMLMRKRNHLYFGLDLETEASDKHPLRQLRERILVTPTEMAKDLCIPQATLVHFEKKFKYQQSVPKCLVNVLDEIGYKRSDIEDFSKAYKNYRARMTGTNVVMLKEGA